MRPRSCPIVTWAGSFCDGSRCGSRGREAGDERGLPQRVLGRLLPRLAKCSPLILMPLQRATRATHLAALKHTPLTFGDF